MCLCPRACVCVRSRVTRGGLSGALTPPVAVWSLLWTQFAQRVLQDRMVFVLLWSVIFAFMVPPLFVALIGVRCLALDDGGYWLNRSSLCECSLDRASCCAVPALLPLFLLPLIGVSSCSWWTSLSSSSSCTVQRWYRRQEWQCTLSLREEHDMFCTLAVNLVRSGHRPVGLSGCLVVYLSLICLFVCLSVCLSPADPGGQEDGEPCAEVHTADEGPAVCGQELQGQAPCGHGMAECAGGVLGGATAAGVNTSTCSSLLSFAASTVCPDCSRCKSMCAYVRVWACSVAQILLGLSLLLSFNILPLFVYGQLMKLRYLISSDSQVRGCCHVYYEHM